MQLPDLLSCFPQQGDKLGFVPVGTRLATFFDQLARGFINAASPFPIHKDRDRQFLSYASFTSSCFCRMSRHKNSE